MTKENKLIKKLYILGFITFVVGGIISWISRNQPLPTLDVTNLWSNFNKILIVQNTTWFGLGATLCGCGIFLLIFARICQVSIISDTKEMEKSKCQN